MSFASFTDLKTSIAEFANRSDITDSLMNDFVTLAEAEFNQRLRCVEQERVDDLTITGRYTSLYSGFLEMRAVEYKGSPVQAMPYITPEILSQKLGESGPPRYYSIMGRQIQVLPVQTDATITITYWEKIPALTNLAPTNWLLEFHPNMYLYECLRQLSLWAKDDNAVVRYAEILAGYFRQMERSDQGRRFGGTSLAMRSA